MAWLLAVFIPALLMLATFGLERLEAAIEVSDADDGVAKMLERATADGTRPRVPTAPVRIDDEPDLPTRICGSITPNPQVRATRQPNPV